MKKITILCFLISFGSFVPVSLVQAISINLNPSSQSANVGDMPTVDIVISGLEETNLDEIVSAFDLDVSFNQNVLAAKDPVFGSFLGDPLFAEALFSSDIVSAPGIIDLAGLSFLSDVELDALQPDSFVLATLAFTVIESGTSPLSFILDPQFGLDIKGRNAAILDDLVADTASINVSGAPVPEPPVILLIGISLLLLVVTSKKHRKFFSI
jgi:hypothetical protein